MVNDGLTTTSSVVNIVSDTDTNTDGDGFGDYQQYLYGTNPNVSNGSWIWTKHTRRLLWHSLKQKGKYE